MTTNTATRIATADASVLSTVRGWPSWAVILLALVLTLGGTAVDGLTTGVLAWGLRIGFYLGVILAALIVRRASIFTPMIQPPLVLVFGLVVGGALFTNAGGLYGTALKIIGTFPTMAIGTAAAVLIGLIRILAQPVRSGRGGVRPPSHA
ncbi:MAG: DUF6542 domain-containing protein [Nakamurella sp.]